jgi:lysophospholipase L1-like esterase
MLNPFWGPAQPLVRAIDSAKAAGATDVMIVSDRLRVLGEVAAPGKVTRITNAEFASGLFQQNIEPHKQFDLFIADLNLEEMKKFRLQEVIALARPYLRPDGKIIVFVMNGGRPIGRLRSPYGDERIILAGSEATIRAMAIYSGALSHGDKSRIQRYVRLLSTLAIRAPQFWWANWAERAAFEKGQVPQPGSRTSVSVTIDAPWTTDEDLFDFESDDGSIEYAADCGAYLGSPAEAPVVALNRVDPGVAYRAESAVILTFGQSNAANAGSGRYTSRHSVYTFNIFDMNYYRAVDPLPGATNDGGSVWSRLGDKLIEDGVFRSVLFVPIAAGGSYLKDWSDGYCHRRLKLALARLKRAGIHVDMLCWHQGEADANRVMTTTEEYIDGFHRIAQQIRSAGVQAPIYVAVASVCANDVHPCQNHDQVRNAQQKLVSLRDGLLPGPDTDQFTGDFRQDGCHFSEKGLEAVAQAWLECVKAHPPQSYNSRRAEQEAPAQPER